MWDTIGFSKNPYDADPLRPVEDDVPLLIGREDEGVKFLTTIESSDHGSVLLAGLPGVGKTSFFNIQQYLLDSGTAPFGRKLLPAKNLCPVNVNDDAHSIALRALYNTCQNMIEFFSARQISTPDAVSQTLSWLNGKGGGGMTVSLSVAGFGAGLGKTAQNTPPNNVTFEVLKQILDGLVREVTEKFDCRGYLLY